MTGEFPAQMASNAENVFIWWRHHEPEDTAPVTIIFYFMSSLRDAVCLYLKNMGV